MNKYSKKLEIKDDGKQRLEEENAAGPWHRLSVTFARFVNLLVRCWFKQVSKSIQQKQTRFSHLMLFFLLLLTLFFVLLLF